MVIFNSYVKLPEGNINGNIYMEYQWYNHISNINGNINGNWYIYIYTNGILSMVYIGFNGRTIYRDKL